MSELAKTLSDLIRRTEKTVGQKLPALAVEALKEAISDEIGYTIQTVLLGGVVYGGLYMLHPYLAAEHYGLACPIAAVLGSFIIIPDLIFRALRFNTFRVAPGLEAARKLKKDLVDKNE